MAKTLKDKVAAIHGRKSRDNGASLDSQINACKDWCERNGISNYDIFMEEGSTSSEEWEERPVLQDLVKKIDQLHYDLVVVTEQSRICRSDDFPKFREGLKEANVLFVQADTGTIYDYANPEDEFMSDIMQAVYKQELGRTKIRLKRGIIQSAKKGNWVGKKVPVGYQYDKHSKRLKLSEEAPIIRKMFDLYMNGLSTNDIAYKFTHENVIAQFLQKGEFKNMVWSSAGISRMLDNPVYAGHSLYGKTTDKKSKGKRKRKITEETDRILELNTHDEIVTQEEFDLVQAIKEKRNSRPPSLKLAKHVFSGLIRCSICGAIHSFQSSKGGKKRITSCQTRHYSDDLQSYTICQNGGSNLEPFEILFYTALENQADKLEKYLDLIQEVKIKDTNNKMKKESQNLAKKKMVQQMKTQLLKIQQGFELGIYEGQEVEKSNEIKKIKAQMKIIYNELQEAEENETISEAEHIEKVLKNIKAFLEGRNNPFLQEREANEYLHEIVETVLYKKEGSEIIIDIVWKEIVREILKETKTA